MSAKRVSIKFCGGCNPRIDRGSLAKELSRFITGCHYEVVYNSLEADFIIYLSGCLANCAQRYSNSRLPCIAVAANTVDAVSVAEGEIALQTIRKAREYFEQMERPVPS